MRDLIASVANGTIGKVRACPLLRRPTVRKGATPELVLPNGRATDTNECFGRQRRRTLKPRVSECNERNPRFAGTIDSDAEGVEQCAAVFVPFRDGVMITCS